MTEKPFALIVDDEWRLAQNLQRYLTRRGYEAHAVTSVGEANKVISARQPVLALIDLKLPDFSGKDLCRQLQQRYPSTDMLVMSARIDEQDQQALDACGVRGYLTKPYPLSELGERLAQFDHGLAVAPVVKAARPVPPPPRLSIRQLSGRNQPRIVLYSHDTMGLGHMRRNILIARTLVESELQANVLLVSGAREIGKFELPPGVDCLVLPSYSKSTAGQYQSRHLDMETLELVNLRSHAINASVSAFDPDLMVVDNVPHGALNELDGVLASMNARGRTRLVLGLRDVLDEPEVTVAEWHKRQNLAAIQWFYDEVWVYGDPKIFNLCEAYQFGPAFDAKVRFTGYLDARKRAVPRPSEIVSPKHEDKKPDAPAYNLCMVGGGQDGFDLALAFAGADQPSGNKGVIITGPFMQPEQIERLHAISAQRDDLEILGFVSEPTQLLQNARRVVAMGGYNTVNEVLAFGQDTLIVPRIRPRLEQLVRAERLSDGGYVDMLHPGELTPKAITSWLSREKQPSAQHMNPIDLQGLDHLVDYATQLIQQIGPTHATA